MPFVWVRVHPTEMTGHSFSFIRGLVRSLPDIVAKALSVPNTEGELTSSEIEVKFEKFGPLDIHTKDVEIMIWANDYPARKEDLDERRKRIVGEVEKHLWRDTTFFVWVLLQPGSFGESRGSLIANN